MDDAINNNESVSLALLRESTKQALQTDNCKNQNHIQTAQYNLKISE